MKTPSSLGRKVLHAIERGLLESRHTVLIITPAAVSSPWVALRRRDPPSTQDPDAREQRLIPVLLEPTEDAAQYGLSSIASATALI